MRADLLVRRLGADPGEIVQHRSPLAKEGLSVSEDRILAILLAKSEVPLDRRLEMAGITKAEVDEWLADYGNQQVLCGHVYRDAISALPAVLRTMVAKAASGNRESITGLMTLLGDKSPLKAAGAPEIENLSTTGLQTSARGTLKRLMSAVGLEESREILAELEVESGKDAACDARVEGGDAPLQLRAEGDEP